MGILRQYFAGALIYRWRLIPLHPREPGGFPVIHHSADVDPAAHVDDTASVWHLVQIRENAQIGAECVISRGVYVGPGVTIGARTKIQNFAQIYDPAVIGAGVFIGPAVVLTNDVYPRSVDPDGSVKRAGNWTAEGVTIGDGASVGARSVVLAGVSIGEWALIGAGSTIIRDVAPHALVVGSPGRQIGWVGRAGHRLTQDDDETWRCPITGESFVVIDGKLISA
jgi:UDP-2-acetamido-3-amino-2,3-dideoxy-glucuronate N-acetyltransferase